MNINEITEGVMTSWGKSGNRTVRKYRCTSGPRKGRVVSKASTCTAPKNITRSLATKKTRRRQGSAYGIKVSRTRRSNPASLRLKSLNKRRKPAFRKTHRGSRMGTRRRKL